MEEGLEQTFVSGEKRREEGETRRNCFVGDGLGRVRAMRRAASHD